MAANIEKMAATLSGEREEQLVEAVEALIAALEARDEYTYGHSSQVSELAQAIGRQLELSETALFELKIAALVHDIGKIGIPDIVLNKPGMLEAEEWSIIRQHPVIGAKILAELPALKDVADIVRHHHEAWNGKGYPDSISGVEIPLAARIIAVADTFRAITSDRPYRKGRSRKLAMVEIFRCADTQFDPEVVKALIRCFPL